MGASAWSVYQQAKDKLGEANFNLGTSTFKAVLFRTSGSATISSDISTLASIGSYTSTAGNGDEVHTLGSLVWSGNASGGAQTRIWDAADFVFTASTQAISSVRYCVNENCALAA